MKHFSNIDAIIRGEDEETTYKYFDHMIKRKSFNNIEGLSYRNGNDINLFKLKYNIESNFGDEFSFNILDKYAKISRFKTYISFNNMSIFQRPDKENTTVLYS